ncbi:MAG: hypothetical protein EXS35_03735 [Pedosphaera sp.]|nr:hypothetical protein [Pedosphaera sp.]
MKTKTLLVLGLAIAIGLAISSRLLVKQSAETAPTSAKSAAAPAPALPAAAPIVTTKPRPVEPEVSDSANTPTAPLPEAKDQPAIAAQSKPAKKPKEPLHDPDARVAMGLVGFDAAAEAYWLEAIYDTSLPEPEREDLIEDLNEDGLSDPKHPGPQDLPVILYRLQRIEEIAVTADDFMLEHLREAYKDLANLAQITQGGGEPVR